MKTRTICSLILSLFLGCSSHGCSSAGTKVPLENISHHGRVSTLRFDSDTNSLSYLGTEYPLSRQHLRYCGGTESVLSGDQRLTCTTEDGHEYTVFRSGFGRMDTIGIYTAGGWILVQMEAGYPVRSIATRGHDR